jgi:DNA (cytosine-5)-methyltransferase 1
MITFTAKVGNNRGRNRVWLEGNRLTKMGWTWHTPYTQEEHAESVVLTKDTNGAKKVAGRNKAGKDTPIIDLAGQYLNFAEGGRVAIVVTEDTITITKEIEA